MDLQRVASDRFLLLQAEWPAMKCYDLISQLWTVDSQGVATQGSPTHVIVRGGGDKDGYYLFTTLFASKHLRGSVGMATAHAALDLDTVDPTPALDGSMSTRYAPERCVVLQQGRLIGFLDTTLAPEDVLPDLGLSRPEPLPPDLTAPIMPSFDVELWGPGGEAAAAPPGEGVDTRLGGIQGPGATSGAPQPGTGPALAERSLVTEFPEQVVLNEVNSLLVSLSANDVQTGTVLRIVQPIGTTIDIIVQARRGFEVVGRDEGSLVVSGDEEVLPIQFKLRATAMGLGQVRVLALTNGVAIGAMTLGPTVVESLDEGVDTGAEQPGPQVNQHVQPLAPVSVRVPDLSVLIEEGDVNGKPALTLRITASDPAMNLSAKKVGPVVLQTDPGPYFAEFYKDIEGYSLATDRDKAVTAQKVAARGAFLTSTLLPPEVQSLLWDHQDQIKSILVQSEEPWIPWELCKLQGRQNDRVMEGPFLCEAFNLTRWLPGPGLKPVLNLSNIAIVVPADSNLALAPVERDYVMSLAVAGRRVTRVPAHYLDLSGALASGEYDCWHFTGHGGYRSPDPNRSAMYLENREVFTPEDIAGVVTNLGQAQPFVFLNACQIGQGGMSLTDIGGWAKQFLFAGAGAFIGAYWSVYDQAACNFAKELYTRLLAGTPMARAVREARLAIKALGDPTWLAYTAFADPMATVQSL